VSIEDKFVNVNFDFREFDENFIPFENKLKVPAHHFLIRQFE